DCVEVYDKRICRRIFETCVSARGLVRDATATRCRIVSDRLNRSLWILRARYGAEVVVVLHGRAIVFGIGDRRRISKRVAIHSVRERICVTDGRPLIVTVLSLDY